MPPGGVVLAGYENPQLKICFHEPPAVMPSKVAYGDSTAGAFGGTGEDTAPCPMRSYTDKCMLAAIDCRTARLMVASEPFDSPYGRAYRHTAITVAPPKGKSVADIALGYDGYRLTRAAVRSGGTLTNSRSLSYYTEGEVTNMLSRGRAYGTGEDASVASVIDEQGRPRRCRALCIGERISLHLKTITAATATYAYEPSLCPGPLLGDSLACTRLRVGSVASSLTVRP